jgi:hypothetical protein
MEAPSREHVIPQWLREALHIQGRVEEYSDERLVGTWDTLTIVLPEVCVSCNTGWMNKLELRTRPILEPLLLGVKGGTSIILDPSQQATLATWAVKTSLLLTTKKFRNQTHSWIPKDNLDWLLLHGRSDRPPPGAHVWMGGLQTTDRPSSVQAALLTDPDEQPAAQCSTFSVGCVLFQVFCCERDKAELSAENEAWLAAKGPYRSSLLQIAPATSALRWPPAEVFTIDALPVVAGRLRDGLGAVSD